MVKVRQQTSTTTKSVISIKNGKPTKTQQLGTFATLREIIKTEGVRGMYRGVSAPMVAVAPIWATSFWGFDTGVRLVRYFAGMSPDARLNVLQLCIAGGFSALPTALVMVPCERIKCILQTQQQVQQQQEKKKQETTTTKANKMKYNGFVDCATQLYLEAGIRGLYKGTALTLMRDVPGNMVYFGVYEVVKTSLGNANAVNPAAAALLAGAAAGVSFWPVILPMDCLKSRYQTAPSGKYNNIGDVYTELVREEGVGGFFRGIRPAMVRSAPANAVSFLGAEVTKSVLSKFM